MSVSQRRIVDTIDGLLARASGTICPSDVARAIGPADGWRELMPTVREIAFQLADDGAVQITQRGSVVDGRTAKGTIRIRRPARDDGVVG